MTRVIDPYRAITDEQVRTCTGRDWAEWLALLNAAGGAQHGLAFLSNYLVRHYRLTRFWAQVVAVYYKWEHWLGN